MSQILFTFGSFGDIYTLFQIISSVRAALNEATGAMAQIRARMDEIKAFSDALGEIERTLISAGASIRPELLNAISHVLRNCLDLLDAAVQLLSPGRLGRVARRAADLVGWKAWTRTLVWTICGGPKEVDALLARASAQLLIIQVLMESHRHQEQAMQLATLRIAAQSAGLQLGQIYSLLQEVSMRRDVTAFRVESFDCTSPADTVVSAWRGRVHQDWFASQPFTAGTALGTTGVMLLTMSHDQGWAQDLTQGSWTWFEVCIARPARNHSFIVEKRASGQELAWRSHTNNIATRQSHRLTGEYFGPEHELWRHVREGHVLLVRAYAQYMGWTNYARKGVLRFMTL